MNPLVVKSREARQDLVACYAFIGQDNPDAADRFLIAADKTFALLAKMPGIGSLYPTTQPDLIGLRSAGINGFQKYLAFYKPIEGGIEIIRVIHGARDLKEILEHGGNGRH